MRTKKAIINSLTNILMYFVILLPTFITRKVFLQTLGPELLGLNSLYANIVSLLSIMELGIGTAIIYSLYKPFANKDKSKVKAYLNFYGKFYRNIGILILVLGIGITPFLEIIIKEQVNLSYAKFYFILFLSNTVSSYLFSYKISILYVAQENYIVSWWTGISKLVINILQIALLIIYPNFTLYILIQVLIDLIYYIIINYKINKKYPWIKNNTEVLKNKEKKNLFQNLYALLFHKIGSFIVLGTDNIIISIFINLDAVTQYNSYNMVVSAVNNIINRGFQGITASIGNLIAKDTTNKVYRTYKRLFFVNFWIISFMCISLFNTLDQFIGLWLGKSQILDNLTVTIILINFYFLGMRFCIDRFKEAGGVYKQDRYAPIAEAIINLVSSIFLVKFVGLAGVFLGTLISNLLVVFWIKPLVVYKNVFKVSVLEYFKDYFKYLFIAFIPLIFTRILTINIRGELLISKFIINCFINIFIINTFYILIFYKNKEFIYFKQLIHSFLNNIKNNRK